MTLTTEAGFVHRYEPAGAEGHTPLLLLHGTGGDENDLLPLGRILSPGAALLSPRGRVLENGMPRFFRRLGEGIFDHEDVRLQADALADFIAAAQARCGMPAPIAVGFSNGANIAAAVLYRRPEVLAGAVLLRAMEPLEEAPAHPLNGKPVLILSGNADTLTTPDNPARLAAALTAAGGQVEHRIVRASHGLTQNDVGLAKAWIEAVEKAARG